MDGNQQIWIRSNSLRAGDTVNPGIQCETNVKQYSTNLAELRSAANFGYGAGFGAPWTVVDFSLVFSGDTAVYSHVTSCFLILMRRFKGLQASWGMCLFTFSLTTVIDFSKSSSVAKLSVVLRCVDASSAVNFRDVWRVRLPLEQKTSRDKKKWVWSTSRCPWRFIDVVWISHAISNFLPFQPGWGHWLQPSRPRRTRASTSWKRCNPAIRNSVEDEQRLHPYSCTSLHLEILNTVQIQSNSYVV